MFAFYLNSQSKEMEIENTQKKDALWSTSCSHVHNSHF